MPKEKKYTLKVVFGEETSSYAGYFGFAKANKRINEGKLEGYAAVFEFDTEDDRNTAIKMLEASDGRKSAKVIACVNHDKTAKSIIYGQTY